MLDLSEEVDEENISTCKSYLERMATMKVGVRAVEKVFMKSAAPRAFRFGRPRLTHTWHTLIETDSASFFLLSIPYGKSHGKEENVNSPGFEHRCRRVW